MGEAILRTLPSLDWLAFGIGVGAMFLHYLWPPLLAVVVLLRETKTKEAAL